MAIAAFDFPGHYFNEFKAGFPSGFDNFSRRSCAALSEIHEKEGQSARDLWKMQDLIFKTAWYNK